VKLTLPLNEVGHQLSNNERFDKFIVCKCYLRPPEELLPELLPLLLLPELPDEDGAEELRLGWEIEPELLLLLGCDIEPGLLLAG
jgi:hypothetical protein